MKLSDNFYLSEMTKSQTAIRKNIDNEPTTEIIENLRVLAVNVLQPIREHFNMPVTVTSGYRSPKLNKAIGGSKTSQHCKGEAADIEIFGVPNGDLAVFIRDNLDFDQVILENYKSGQPNSGWVHVSYKSQNNRKQVLTFDGKKYHQGLIM